MTPKPLTFAVALALAEMRYGRRFVYSWGFTARDGFYLHVKGGL